MARQQEPISLILCGRGIIPQRAAGSWQRLMKNHKISRGNVKKAAIASLSWTFLTTFLGLIQVWITMVISYLLKNKEYNLRVALEEGSLLFFIMAVTIAITIDYHFSENIHLPQWIRSVMFTLLPFLIGILVTALYSTLYIADENELNQSAFIATQSFLIGLTILYAFIAKLLIFLYEESNK
jgi:vacuolar-type H+-ATPase subunit I/STV1